MTGWTAGHRDMSYLGAGKIVEGPHICPPVFTVSHVITQTDIKITCRVLVTRDL